MRRFFNFSLILCILFMVSGCANLMEEKSSETRIVVDMRQSRAAISWDEVSSWRVAFGKLPDDMYVPKEALSNYSEFENFVDKNEIYSVVRELRSSQKYFESEELEPGSYFVAIGLCPKGNEDDIFAFGASVVKVESGKTAEADILVNRISSGGNGSGDLSNILGIWVMDTADENITNYYVYDGWCFVVEAGKIVPYLIYSNGNDGYWKYGYLSGSVDVTVTGNQYSIIREGSLYGVFTYVDDGVTKKIIRDNGEKYMLKASSDLLKPDPIDGNNPISDALGFTPRPAGGGNGSGGSFSDIVNKVWLREDISVLNDECYGYEGWYFEESGGSATLYEIVTNESKNPYWCINKGPAGLVGLGDNRYKGQCDSLNNDFTYDSASKTITFSGGIVMKEVPDLIFSNFSQEENYGFINGNNGFRYIPGKSSSDFDPIMNKVWVMDTPDESIESYYAYKGVFFTNSNGNIEMNFIYSNNVDVYKIYEKRGLFSYIKVNGSRCTVYRSDGEVYDTYAYDDSEKFLKIGDDKYYLKDASSDDVPNIVYTVEEIITSENGFKVRFNWYETPVAAESDGTYGTEGTYVYFGVWPQDVVPESDVESLGLECSTKKVTRGYMEYVEGTDGNYYVKCAENAYTNNSSDTYKDGSAVGTGGTESRWFKAMPIKWRVVDENYEDADNVIAGKLLVAENILTANVPYYDDKSNRMLNDVTVYPNNYMYSQIRAYLNGISYNAAVSSDNDKWYNKGFLQTAFGETAMNTINDTNVNNSAISTTNYDGQDNGLLVEATAYACDPTEDKIFLLSEYEVTKYSKSTESYNASGAGNSRIRIATDFAKANYAFQNKTDGNGGYWWLRTPYSSKAVQARGVSDVGKADYYGDVHQSFRGVVPALCISF